MANVRFSGVKLVGAVNAVDSDILYNDDREEQNGKKDGNDYRWVIALLNLGQWGIIEDYHCQDQGCARYMISGLARFEAH